MHLGLVLVGEATLEQVADVHLKGRTLQFEAALILNQPVSADWQNAK